MTKEEAYEKATMQELGGNPNGTRQDVVWRAMEIYSQQVLINSLPKFKVLSINEDGSITFLYDPIIRG